MPFSPVDITRFGGLVTNTDVEDATGATAISNVLVARSGTRLEPRPGYTLNGTLDLSGTTGVAPIGSSQVLAGTAGTTLNLITASTGASVTSKTDYTTGTPWTIVPFGNASTATIPTIDNPSFATNTTYWSAPGSTITRDTVTYDSSPASGRWDKTGASDTLIVGSASSVTISGTFLAGNTYTVLVRVKASAPGGTITAGLGAGTESRIETWSFDSTGWVWRAVSFKPTVTATSNGLLAFVVASGTSYYYIDSLEMVVAGKAYASNGAALAKLTTDSTLVAPLASTQTAAETAFVAGRAAPIPITLGVQPKDNRLVAAGFASTSYGPNGTASSGSHVYFSEPDNPDTSTGPAGPDAWDETNYVILSPGDGETIRACATWNDYLLVFKQTKFFVFYGNSTDATGGPVFNYRTVRDCWPENQNAIYQGNVLVAPDGVYVITSGGVYRTTGGAPELATGALTNLFTAGTIVPTQKGSGGAFHHNGDLWFSITYGGSQAWLVRHEGQWLIWDLTDDPVVGCSIGGVKYLPSGVSTSGRKGLLKMDGTATADNATAITGYYTSPYQPIAGSGAESHVRYSELHGTGTVTLAWGKDEQAHGSASTIAMTNGLGYDRAGARGRTLSWKIAFTAAGWTVDRLTAYVQKVRSRT